jgi:DNA-binding CsgD family transcriptional regulator
MELKQSRQASLSRRELEIAAMVAEGLTNRGIAARMFLSERTVDSHLEHIREKLGVSNRAQVATWFVAQTQPVATVEAPPAVRAGAPRRTNRWLPVLAIAVVVVVAGAVIYERFTPPISVGPAITTFRSVDPGDKLSFASGVAVGSDGSVYVADRNGLTIRRIDPKAGSITSFAGGGAAPSPGDFVDGGDRLKTSVGFVLAVAVPPGGGSLYYANGFMVGKVAADSTIQFVAGRRDPLAAPPGIKGPVGLAFGPDGTLYIADIANQVWKLATDGTLSVFAGNGQEGFAGDGGPAAAAELDHPRAVAVEPDGDVLIADTDNNRIREVVHGSSEIVTVAGSGSYYGFSGDGGPAKVARLSLPWGVAVGPAGTIYVADAGNDRVRSIDPKGIITTLAHGDLNAPAGVAVSPSGDVYVVCLGDPWLRRVHIQ